MKKKSAFILTGMTLFILIIVFRTTSIGWHVLPASSFGQEVETIQDLDYMKHYSELINRLGCTDDSYMPVAIKGLAVDTTYEGLIDSFSYDAYFMKNNKYYHGFIDYDRKKRKFTVKTEKIHIWKYSYRMVSMQDCFTTLNQMKYEDVISLLDAEKNDIVNIAYKGWYTFDEDDGKETVAYLFEDGNFELFVGEPALKRTTMTINKRESTGGYDSKPVEILFDGYSNDYRNPNT